MRVKPTKEKFLNFSLTQLWIKKRSLAFRRKVPKKKIGYIKEGQAKYGKKSRLSEGKEGRNYENEIATLNTYQCGLLRGRIE